MSENSKYTHRAALLATYKFPIAWNEFEGSENEFYDSLFDSQKSIILEQLEALGLCKNDAPEPAKMPLETAVEILRDYFPQSSELAGKAIDRVVELVPEYMRLAQMVVDYEEMSVIEFSREYNSPNNASNLKFLGNTAQALLQK